MLLTLRLLFSSGNGERRYSINQLQKFEAVLNQNGMSLLQFKSILDFGCGFGRLTQHLFELIPNTRIFGCDTEPHLVATCRKKFPQGTFITNNPTPPLDVNNEVFDLIFSYSVFTHLSESNHAAWLKELAEKLRPGGIMMHTIHSYEALKRLEIFSPESLDKYKLPEPVHSFFQPSDRYHYNVTDVSKPEYGYTIISKDYVMKKWPTYSGLRLVDYAEGAIESYPEGCHDIILLVKETS